ncbi:tetratricopeptide repeat protein [Hymenobacter cellulosilyticus]|uniref:Tetratricopeptide repeat protein n=1 Tax=Hymenobacter cellulosilyticus TaxID=2932248 RepID=A0A8T9QEB2_9BACT|nr:tetratricopeptide repeat protein [Hymenobacter cellulosilyticus]
MGSFNRAAYHFRQALRLDQQVKNQSAVALDEVWLGSVLWSQGDTGQARLVYRKALQTFSRLGSRTGEAQVQTKLGRLYAQQKKWGQALASHSRALQGWLQHQDTVQAAAALNAMGSVYLQQKAYSRALFYLRKARRTAKASDSLRQSESLVSIGKIYQAMGNYENALPSFREASRLMPARALPAPHAQLYYLMAAAYDSLGQQPAAEQALQQALVLARRSGSLTLLSQQYRALAAVYRRMGHYPKALAALTRFSGLQDSVFAQERSAQVAELRMRYETEKKEREIELLTKDRQIREATMRRQALLRNALAAGAYFYSLSWGALPGAAAAGPNQPTAGAEKRGHQPPKRGVGAP